MGDASSTRLCGWCWEVFESKSATCLRDKPAPSTATAYAQLIQQIGVDCPDPKSRHLHQDEQQSPTPIYGVTFSRGCFQPSMILADDT